LKPRSERNQKFLFGGDPWNDSFFTGHERGTRWQADQPRLRRLNGLFD
jgi:hypothetical protein